MISLGRRRLRSLVGLDIGVELKGRDFEPNHLKDTISLISFSYMWRDSALQPLRMVPPRTSHRIKTKRADGIDGKGPLLASHNSQRAGLSKPKRVKSRHMVVHISDISNLKPSGMHLTDQHQSICDISLSIPTCKTLNRRKHITLAAFLLREFSPEIDRKRYVTIVHDAYAQTPYAPST
jgi:hypothetical protein